LEGEIRVELQDKTIVEWVSIEGLPVGKIRVEGVQAAAVLDRLADSCGLYGHRLNLKICLADDFRYAVLSRMRDLQPRVILGQEILDAIEPYNFPEGAIP